MGTIVGRLDSQPNTRITYPGVMAPKAEGPTPEEEEAAERKWRRAETYDRDNRFHSEQFAKQVAQGKPTVDFVAMLGVSAVAVTVAMLAADDMRRDGWSDRRALGALIALSIAGHLWTQVSLATSSQIARILLRALYRIGAPHPNDWDSRTLRGIWNAIIVTAGVAVPLVVGAMGFEFTQAARRIGDRAAVARPATPPTKATEPALLPTDDRHVAP